MARTGSSPELTREAGTDDCVGTESPRGGSRIWLTVRLLLVVLAFLCIWRGHQHLIAWKASLPEHRIDGETIRILGAPEWLDFEDVRSIHIDSGIASERLSFFTPDLEERLDAAFRKSPWVARVWRTRLTAPNRVDVYLELKFGKPIAGVRGMDGSIYLVNDDGVRMPGVRNALPEGLGHPFRLIEGVDAVPPAPGCFWSEAVRQGALVAREILDLSPEAAASSGIDRIDVSNVGGRLDRLEPEVNLVTRQGTIVEWGRCSASPLGDLDPQVPDKLRRLERALDVHHGFYGLRRVKLQYDELRVVEIDAIPLERIAPDVHGG